MLYEHRIFLNQVIQNKMEGIFKRIFKN